MGAESHFPGFSRCNFGHAMDKTTLGILFQKLDNMQAVIINEMYDQMKTYFNQYKAYVKG